MASNGGGSNAVGLRFSFYRDGFALSLLINFALSIILIGCFIFIYQLVKRPPESKYFTVDMKGNVVPIVPMNKPHMTESAILDFASKVVTESYTFDADNYRLALTNVQKYFTPDGYSAFQTSMQPQIKYVKDNVLIASSVPSGTPVLLKRGIISSDADGDIVAWKIRIPVVVTYRTKTDSSTVKRTVQLVIVNRPTYESEFGVGVSSFQASDQN